MAASVRSTCGQIHVCGREPVAGIDRDVSIRGVFFSRVPPSNDLNPSNGYSKRPLLVLAARKSTQKGFQKFEDANSQLKSDRYFIDWNLVAEANELVEGKNKAVIIDQKGYVVVLRQDKTYALEANCSSCKFPIVQGKVDESPEGIERIECPLCHSKFSLEDGSVLEWSPKDGALQFVIGTLMQKQEPQGIKVFPTRRSKSQQVYIKLE